MYNEEFRNKELSNGRMAMISMLGIWAAEAATGKDAMQQFGFSALPRHASQASSASAFAGSTVSKGAGSKSTSLAATATLGESSIEGAPDAKPPFDPSKQVGAMAPLGYFDPLGFCPVGAPESEEAFRQMRSAELKHGRVAMMASIGAVGQHFIRLPPFVSTKGTFTAATSNSDCLWGLVAIVVGCAFLENVAWTDDEEKEPGNFGDPLGLNMYTEEFRNKELSNGRMAMISVLGIWGAELATGKDAMQQFGV